MRTVPIRVLTWGTAAAAVSSAVWLSTAAVGCSADLHAPAADIELVDLIAPTAAPAAGSSPAGVPGATPLGSTSGK